MKSWKQRIGSLFGWNNSDKTSSTESRRPETLDEVITDAANQTFAKSAKLEAASDAVVVEQMRGIAQDELETVKRYKEWKVFGNKTDPPPPRPPSDFIVADDMQFTFEQPKQSALGPFITLLAAGALGFGGYALWNQMNKPAVEKVINTPGKTTVITEPGKTRDWGVGKAKVQ